MPYEYDASRWNTHADGTHSRAVGERPGKGPNATEGALELAAAYGLDITEVSGSGKNGRITKADVEAHLEDADE